LAHVGVATLYEAIASLLLDDLDAAEQAAVTWGALTEHAPGATNRVKAGCGREEEHFC